MTITITLPTFDNTFTCRKGFVKALLVTLLLILPMSAGTGCSSLSQQTTQADLTHLLDHTEPIRADLVHAYVAEQELADAKFHEDAMIWRLYDGSVTLTHVETSQPNERKLAEVSR